jgi:hypothetical protein
MKRALIGIAVLAAIVAVCTTLVKLPRGTNASDIFQAPPDTIRETDWKRHSSHKERRQSGPTDPRLRRLMNGEPTGYGMDDFREYLSENGSNSISILACYLLTDFDPAAIDLFDKAPPNQTVFWTIPIWRDRTAADKILSKYKNSPLDIFAFNRPIAELWGLPRNGDAATIIEKIQALASGAAVPYSHFKKLEESMRDALASVGLQGTKAEILIEQCSMNSATLSSVSVGIINDAWQHGLATFAEGERESFTLDCLTALSNLESPEIDVNSHAYRLKIAMANTLPNDMLINGNRVSEYIASLEEQITRTDTVYDRFFAEFQKASPATIDRYYELRQSDPAAARRFVMDSSK